MRFTEYNAGMKKQASTRQYTIRNVPRDVDLALRRRAKVSGKSINQVALEALTEGSGERKHVYDDLDFLIGTLSPEEAKDLDREIAEQRAIDDGLWR
jgi:hypothetical protein